MSEDPIDYMKNSFHSSLHWLQSKIQSLNTDDEGECIPTYLHYNDKRFNAKSNKQGGWRQSEEPSQARSNGQGVQHKTRLTMNRLIQSCGTSSNRNSAKQYEIAKHKQLEHRRHSYSPNMLDPKRQKNNKSTGLLKASSNANTQGNANSTRSLTHTGSSDLNRLKQLKNYSAGSNVCRNVRRLDNECRRAIYEIKYNRNDDDACSMEASDTDSLNGILSCTPPITQTYKRLNEYNFTYEPFSLQLPNTYGEMKIMFQFLNEENDLHVTLLRATNVARSRGGALGVYAKVCLMPGKTQMKVGHDKHNTHNPVFCELFRFRIKSEELFDREIKVKLFNKRGIFSRSEAIGECSIALRQYDPTAITVIWQNLKKSRTGQKVRSF